LTIDVYITDDLADNADRADGDYHNDDCACLLGYFTTLYQLFSCVASNDVNNFGGSSIPLAWSHCRKLQNV
jgi:hypothetical protein